MDIQYMRLVYSTCKNNKKPKGTMLKFSAWYLFFMYRKNKTTPCDIMRLFVRKICEKNGPAGRGFCHVFVPGPWRSVFHKEPM